MVVGGEVVTLKSIEESTGVVMQEMPMQVSLLANSYVLSHKSPLVVHFCI
jgi:hypothetical protein